MIQAGGVFNGRPTILIGLTRRNLEALTAGRPITFDATPVGFTGTVVVVVGETNEDIAGQMRQAGLITDETNMVDRTGPSGNGNGNGRP